MTVESHLKNDEISGSIYSVSELNEAVSKLLGLEFGLVWLRGEVSTLTRASSGHLYLSIKDERSVVKAVMFRARQAFCAFTPSVGDQIEVQARLGLYEPRGDFQLNIQVLRRAGRGTLNEQFELLKAKLQAEGLFDMASKREIARMPRVVGVITSLGAAALHDVLTTLARRAPHVRVIVYPSLVQGQGAPLALRRALARANERGEVDTLLLVRGGGSLEDLWAFNDENLARDIAASAIPVVSGVGHESDTTIADFVADLRAPTPTAAAELCCAAQVDLIELVLSRVTALGDRLSRRLERWAQRVDRQTIRLLSPSQRIAARVHRLALLSQRLAHIAPAPLKLQAQVEQLQARINAAWQSHAQKRQWRLQAIEARLQALCPEAPLDRGYAIVRGPDGKIVSEPNRLAPKDELSIAFARGAVTATVKKVSTVLQTHTPKRD